jgi:hypothetical protein
MKSDSSLFQVAILIYFGGLHYLGKPGETALDLVNVTLIGLFLCFTVRRTGDVWCAGIGRGGSPATRRPARRKGSAFAIEGVGERLWLSSWRGNGASTLSLANSPRHLRPTRRSLAKAGSS